MSDPRTAEATHTGPPSRPGSQGQEFRSAIGTLAIAPFRYVWLAALSGNSGRFCVILVAGWEAYRLGGHSALWPSLVSLFLLVPTMLFGLIAGSLADRLNRAKMAAAGQILNGLACAVAAGCIWTHLMTLAAVLTISAAVGIGNSIQGPSWQALVPSLVGTDRMVSAALVTRIAQQGSELVGPALGTIVLTAGGPAPTFLLCGMFYGIGSLLLIAVRRHAVPGRVEDAGSVPAQIAAGIGYIRSTRPLGLLFVWVTLHCSLTMATFGLLPTIASANFSGSAGVYGLLLTAFGAGSVLGPLIVMAWGSKPRMGWLLSISGILSGAPLIVVGFTDVMGLALFMCVLAGVGQAVFMSMIYASMMNCARDGIRGRVSSVQLSATTGAMGLASLGWGALVTVASAGVVLAAPGAAFVVVCLALIRRLDAVSEGIDRQLRSILLEETDTRSEFAADVTSVTTSALDRGSPQSGPIGGHLKGPGAASALLPIPPGPAGQLGGTKRTSNRMES